MNVEKIPFENNFGNGYIEVTGNKYERNTTFEVVVEETYKWYSEEDVIGEVESNIYKYL